MATARRIIRYVAWTVAAVLIVALGLFLVLTRTDFGVERTGRFVLDRLEGSINGSLTVGRVSSGRLLEGVTLHDVTLLDADGRPFVEADSARLSYRLRTLLGGAVAFDRLTLYGPDVTIERLPGQERWNYDRIFADTAAPADTTTTSADDALILIRQATVHDGRVTVRWPWQPGAAADTTRLVVETVPGGRVRTLRFDSVNARLPQVVWESPETEGQVLTIERLATRAFIWKSPLEVDDLSGVLTIRDSIIELDAGHARLPDSELRLDGRIVVGSEHDFYDVRAVGERVAFRDFRWLYPALPAEGGGALRFRIQTRGPGTVLWLAREMDIATGGSEVAGSFGIETGDTFRFTDVDVRATPLDLDLLAAVLPGDIPLSGLVIGTATAEGPLSGFRTDGDVRLRTFDEAGHGVESSFAWDGVLGVVAPYPLRDLRVELDSVPLTQIAQFAPGLRVRGTARGTVQANGSLDSGLRVSGDVSLTHEGERSVMRGSGRFALGDTPTFDLQFDADPIDLELVAQQAPSLTGLQGQARGPVTVSGSLDDLTIDADIGTPAGDVVLRGNLALNGRARYRGEGSVTEFRVDRVVRGMPETMVTSRFTVEGSGTALEEMDGDVSVDILSATVDEIEVYRGTLRGGVSDALARIDTLAVTTEVGDLAARGSFGLIEDRTGELDVTLQVDSVVFLEPILFEDLGEPLDLGLEQATRLDGRISVEGQLVGSLADWRIGGTARVRSLHYEELELARGTADVTWQPDSLLVEARLDSLWYGDRWLARVDGTASYGAGRGVVTVDIQGRREQRLTLESAFEPQGEVVNLGLRQLHLTTRDGDWTLPDTANVTVGGSGFRVDSLLMVRDPAGGRIRIAGVLPWRQPEADEVQEADLAIDLDGVRIGEFLRFTQTDTLVGGVATGRFRVTGTAMEPELDGHAEARPFRYAGAVLDSVRADVTYADQRLAGSFTGWQGGTSIVTGEARVPVELALTAADDRLLDRPMDVSFDAAGIPAELLSFLAPGFRDVEGRVVGDLAVRGTPVSPDLQGSLQLVDGAATFEPLAVAYRDIQATARMVEGTTMDVEADFAANDGRGRIQGTMDLEDPGDPRFDLQVNAERMTATRRRDVTAVVDGVAQVRGRYTRPVITGDLTILRGELNLDEIWRQHQIVHLDTTLFQMLDTTQVSYRPAPDVPFLENLRVVDATLRTSRNFWLRSQELNVEVGGTLALNVDRRTDDFRLTGTLQVVEGNYQLLARSVPSGRRFDIRDGTIEFVGTPGINPNLDIDAAYRVRRPQGEPINVIASVTGTLQDPRVSLSSDAEIPLSETDLASYILFGRAGAELSQAQLDATAGGSLAYGFFSPVFSGAASTLTQQVVSNLGIPVDYVAFSLPEYGVVLDPTQNPSGLGLLQNAQLEVGFDPTSNVSVIGSVRIPGSEASEERASALRLFGARVEYRPWQTWTIEGYIEDWFARRPSFGPAEIFDRKVLGLSFFREWGY